MPSFDDLQGTPRKTGGRGQCAWCGKPAAAVVELRLSKWPHKGKREKIASMERRLCEGHAVAYFRLLEGGPRR
jgi:hypothetical protein